MADPESLASPGGSWQRPLQAVPGSLHYVGGSVDGQEATGVMATTAELFEVGPGAAGCGSGLVSPGGYRSGPGLWVNKGNGDYAGTVGSERSGIAVI